MRWWIVFCGGAAVLGLAAWYGGRPAPTPVIVVAPSPAAVAAAPTSPPPRVIESIDLARAYEPVREPEPVYPGGVNPASFIEIETAPPRIPYAVAEDGSRFRDLFEAIRRTPLGAVLFGPGETKPERIEVMPREVATTESRNYLIPIGVSLFVPVESLHVMPREVIGPTQDLLNFLVEFGWM